MGFAFDAPLRPESYRRVQQSETERSVHTNRPRSGAAAATFAQLRAATTVVAGSAHLFSCTSSTTALYNTKTSYRPTFRIDFWWKIPARRAWQWASQTKWLKHRVVESIFCLSDLGDGFLHAGPELRAIARRHDCCRGTPRFLLAERV